MDSQEAGNLPWSFGSDKVKAWLWQMALLAAGAICTYLLTEVIPAIPVDGKTGMVVVVTVLTTLLQGLSKWITDNRTPEQIQRMSARQARMQLRMMKK